MAASSAPLIAYVMTSTLLLGLAVFHSSWDMQGQHSNKDIWQHVAALRALIADLGAASNPFVASEETSRHYHPMWLGTALVARVLDLTIWQALAMASALSMAVLAAGIHAFARAFYTSPWGPLVLLGTMMSAWIIQPAHTGFHSFHTLLFAAFYPATTMIGCSLLMWALVIRALASSQSALGLLAIPLTAVMVATHQLGAAIGLVGAGCLVVLWPEGRPARRMFISAALLAGVGLSLLWPFHNPLELILRPGNSEWVDGADFFNPVVLALFTVPLAVGLLGLCNRRGRAILAAIIVFGGIYAIGFDGPQVTGRFLMPIVLCLQIGVAALILSLLDHPRIQAIPRIGAALAAGLAGLLWLSVSLTIYTERHTSERPSDPAPYAAALALTADIPDTEEIVAPGLVAWPIVATGQRVHSVPWPEPGIENLATRQAATEDLLAPDLTAEARVAMAQSLGMRTIIVDRRGTDLETRARLRMQAVRVIEHGDLVRFDLVAE